MHTASTDEPRSATRPSVRLALAPEPRLLGTVRLVVATAGRRFGLDEEQIEDLKVAVSETCAVSMRLVRDAGLDSPVELDLFTDAAATDGGAARFGVEVRDRAPDRDAEDDAPDGVHVGDRSFGLALVSSLVADVTSVPRDDGGWATRFWLPARAATSGTTGTG